MVDIPSGVATRGSRGAECHPCQQNICQNSGKKREKSGKIGKKEGKSGRKGKKREASFTLPLLTDRAGYATRHTAHKAITKKVVIGLAPKFTFKGRVMGSLLALVFPCLRKTVIVTCKIVSFLCSLDSFLLENVIVFIFWKPHFKMAPI